jgi:hypothetical protein
MSLDNIKEFLLDGSHHIENKTLLPVELPIDSHDESIPRLRSLEKNGIYIISRAEVDNITTYDNFKKTIGTHLFRKQQLIRDYVNSITDMRQIVYINETDLKKKFPDLFNISGGSKRKSSKKKKGGSVAVNSQATVLQSASYAPSLDNSFLSQSKLVGGKKKRTQKKRRSSKRGSRKNCWSLW